MFANHYFSLLPSALPHEDTLTSDFQPPSPTSVYHHNIVCLLYNPPMNLHTLFALEDMYGIKISETAGNLSLSPDPSHKEFSAMTEMLTVWAGWSKKLQDGEISKEEYDNWRYNYPKNTSGYVSMKP